MAKNLEKSLEAMRQQVTDYEQGTAEARASLEAFEAEHSEQLAAIQDEYEDYGNHPLFRQRTALDGRTYEPVGTYQHWYNTQKDSLGWQRDIVTPGMYPTLEPHKLERSPVPTTVREFERRAAIASGVGQVAAMLHAANGEPIVSVASYRGGLKVERDPAVRLKSYVDDYDYGKVSSPKTRAIVGLIDQPDSKPALTVQPTREERDSQPSGLRLTMAGRVAGTIAAYSFLSEKRPFQQSIVNPQYFQTRGFGKNEFRTVPPANPVIGDFSIEQLRGHDLLVLDAPHRTAADYEFPGTILLHRPKQRIEQDNPSQDQEIAVMPHEVDRSGAHSYGATVANESSEAWLPAYRHDTIWLVGCKAIEARLADAIAENTTAENKRRGTEQAVLRAVSDLVEQVASGQYAESLSG